MTSLWHACFVFLFMGAILEMPLKAADPGTLPPGKDTIGIRLLKMDADNSSIPLQTIQAGKSMQWWVAFQPPAPDSSALATRHNRFGKGMRFEVLAFERKQGRNPHTGVPEDVSEAKIKDHATGQMLPLTARTLSTVPLLLPETNQVVLEMLPTRGIKNFLSIRCSSKNSWFGPFVTGIQPGTSWQNSFGPQHRFEIVGAECRTWKNPHTGLEEDDSEVTISDAKGAIIILWTGLEVRVAGD
jgi:hypothetical protein